jgi:hypothetical protein
MPPGFSGSLTPPAGLTSPAFQIDSITITD